MRILKFLCSGGIGALVNLSALYVFVDIFGVPYLAGSIFAFCVSAVVGFLLQKFWTFGEQTSSRTIQQFVLYFIVVVTNLAANTLIVYLLVEVIGLHYLLAQGIGIGAVSVASYFIYQRIVFRPASV